VKHKNQLNHKNHLNHKNQENQPKPPKPIIFIHNISIELCDVTRLSTYLSLVRFLHRGKALIAQYNTI
jgi:hypothetical protein